MKSLILATVLSASFAFAGTFTSHDYSDALRGIELNNACLTADTVRTIRPVPACATALRDRNAGRTGEEALFPDWHCPRYKSVDYEFPRSYERRVCTDLRKVGHGDNASLECKAFGYKSGYLPEVISIKVWEERGESSTWPGTTRRFKFPACN